MSTNSLLTRPQATCGTLLTSEYLLTFPFRLEQTPQNFDLFSGEMQCTARCSQRVAQRKCIPILYMECPKIVEPHVAFYVNDQAKTKVF